MTHVNLLALQKQADIQNPEMLLELALPLIIRETDAVSGIEVLRLTRGGMVVWHSANSEHEIGAFIPLENDSIQKQTIQSQETIRDNDARVIYFPLSQGKNVFALMAIRYDTLSDDEQVSLQNVADELAVMLYAQQINYLLRQQIATTRQLTTAESLVDVTTIIAKTMTQEHQFITMNLFVYDSDGQVVDGRVTASANRKKSMRIDNSMGVNIEALYQLHHALVTDGDMIIHDVEEEQYINEAGKQWMRDNHIKSLIIVPVWIESQLHAFLSLADTTHSLVLSDLEKEVFHNIAHQASITIERQQMLEQTRYSARKSGEQVQILRRINELIEQTNREDSATHILQDMADLLLDVTGVDHVGVVMSDGNIMRVVSEAPRIGVVGTEIETGERSIHDLLKETKQAFIAVDVVGDETLPVKTRDDLLKTGVKSAVIVPMFDASNHLIGSIGMDYYTKQETIDPEMIEATHSIVTQVTLSLQKIRLLADAQQKAAQLEQLTEFGQALRAHLTVARILSTTLEYCPEIMQSDYVSVLLYDRPSHSLRLNASHFQGENRILMQADAVTAEINSVALQAWDSHELVKVDDLHADWDLKHNRQRDLQSIIAVPLFQASVALGILEVGSIQPGHFNETDVTTLRQISNQLAIALSNAQAYSQSQRLVRNKIQANEIISKLQEQLEVSNILSITVQELGKALGAKRGRIRLGTEPDISAGDK